MQHVAIIGGGVIGLMTARELALAGCRVSVLERGEIGREASWAGGGIVSPLYPWRYAPPVTALASQAQAAYPQLARELLEATGVDPELEACGLLMLDAHDRRDAVAWAAAHGKQLEILGAASLYQQFPLLAPGFQEGLWMPEIANIRNPRLLRALRADLERRPGVSLREKAEVVAIDNASGHCRGVRLATGELVMADAVVVCGGAWSARVLEGLGQPLAVRPVQGQMIMYQMAPGALPGIIMAQGRYLIPRRDGLVLCGSTLDEVGFDKHTTADALASLQRSAEAMWPALKGVTPVGHWAGLRPGSPNGIPFIGAVPGVSNLWVNAGQFRNGLVLAPASARLLADLLLARPTALDPAPYRL